MFAVICHPLTHCVTHFLLFAQDRFCFVGREHSIDLFDGIVSLNRSAVVLRDDGLNFCAMIRAEIVKGRGFCLVACLEDFGRDAALIHLCGGSERCAHHKERACHKEGPKAFHAAYHIHRIWENLGYHRMA